jgi:prepilin-type processing-associated H-X9-DG protein
MPHDGHANAITQREVIIVTVVILILLGLLTPSILKARERANRVKCADNLKRIGQAILLYTNDNKGLYPKTFGERRPTVIPTWGTGASARDPFGPGGPAPNDVTAALFLLLRTQDIQSDVFVCPSSKQHAWDYGSQWKTARDWCNWSDVATQLSYSYQNLYVDESSSNRTDRQLGFGGRLPGWNPTTSALAADLNPGKVPGRSLDVVGTPTTLPIRGTTYANSPNHDQAGQNVLYMDGHVNFEQTPFVGPLFDHLYDNIYTTRDGGVVASPYDWSDSILLPTAP